ncbi:hypothetical protein JW992_01900 [candidate division KSB1 bacterium]|nr:hypothetical protein [candidate division KSB1 bacterium]
MKAVSPGKIILSGEHAVVQGKPALALAVNRHVTVELHHLDRPHLIFVVPSLGLRQELSLPEWRESCRGMQERYREFAAGRLPIAAVAPKPLDLASAALWVFHSQFDPPATGLEFVIHSALVMGGGMGSSAATGAALLVALAAWHGQHEDADRLYPLLFEVEKLQHGRPSGVDPYVVLHGGFVRFQSGEALKLDAAELPRFTLYDSGRPQSTTGECVARAAEHRQDAGLWHEFEQVTERLQRALEETDPTALLEAIRANHRLLCRIGVVPMRVQQFVAAVEALGSAAKISGAGTIRGDQAGLILVPGEPLPEKVVQQFGYRPLFVQGEMQGARIDSRFGAR